ncbi:hypothetical protein Tco_0906990 [Tanacetum coccineum]|uniref:Uncharacterized protein n=1 Tax=Tanacetum coccineum TaxID=301880 RepID=A0ABQ5CI05_9ASTR
MWTFMKWKMAREAELEKQRVLILVMGWQNQYGTMQTELIMLITLANVNSVRQNVNFVKSNVNTVRPKQPVPTRSSLSRTLDGQRSIMKDKSDDFETPTQGKTLGEADISSKGLEAAETLAKVLTQRTKTYTRKVKTGLRRKLDADEVSTGEEINTGFTDVSTAFTDVNTTFEEIKSGDDEVNSGNESIIPSPKKGQREGKAVFEEKSQSKRTKKQIKEEQASLAEIVRLQAQEETENARKAELQRQDALIAKR